MKVPVPEGAIKVGQEEDGRWAVILSGEGLEGVVLLDNQRYLEAEAEELGGMFWRVFERWLAARQALKS
jgi:hypothetical protein|uniref:SMI1/KNR4 family protein n=1 Tax=Desulfobacca acetoxidans TaxID=60893 RepID=A0A7C5AN61_9BACT